MKVPLFCWFYHFLDSRAEICQIFSLLFWKIWDTKFLFWNHLTFSYKTGEWETNNKNRREKQVCNLEASPSSAQRRLKRAFLNTYIIFVHVFNTLGFMFTHSFNILPSYMLWNIQSQDSGTGSVSAYSPLTYPI